MTDENHESDSVLGDDPFDGLDTEWIEEDEIEMTLESIGHDPFEGVDVDWMEDEGPILRLAPESTKLVLDEFEAEPELNPSEEPALSDVDDIATEKATDSLMAEPLSSEDASGDDELVPGSAIDMPEEGAPYLAYPQATFHFPTDMLWGVSAAAAHQVEGNNTNSDWWTWEQEHSHISGGQTSGKACDWWRNAEADFDRAADLGIQSMRLSVAWSRVEPRAGVFDDTVLERYARMLQGLLDRDIEPMVTLHHFTSPRWFTELGGWENPEAIGQFARFVRRTVSALKPYCTLWCTIHEPNVYAYRGYIEGVFPPGKTDPRLARRVVRHMLQGHAAAYGEIHDIQRDARVGMAHNMRVFNAANPQSLLDRRATRVVKRAHNEAILIALDKGRWISPLGLGFCWKLRGTLDWIGLNYCARDLVAFDRACSKTMYSRRTHAHDAELLDGGYGEFYPEGILRCLRRMAQLDLPIYITENGMPDAGDDLRPRYILTHLHQVWQAIQACYQVMGYYHRSLVDTFEWTEGWNLRFGLIEVDPHTQRRILRDSADLYSDIVRENAITPEIISSYAPQLREELLPGTGPTE